MTMSSQRGNDGVDFWSEIAAENQQQPQPQPQITVTYRRKKPGKDTDANIRISQLETRVENRVSLAPNKRVSWNRSLSTRGRTSIAISVGVDHLPQLRQREAKKKPKALPNRKVVEPPNYDKERAYFQEVDSFELLEESPSPKNFGTWTMGIQSDHVSIPHVSSRLEKWLISKKLNYSCEPSSSLSSILETTATGSYTSKSLNETTIVEVSTQRSSGLHSVQNRVSPCPLDSNAFEIHTCSQKIKIEDLTMGNEGSDEIGLAIKKLSLTSQSASLYDDQRDPFSLLLKACRQSSPSTLLDVFSQFCDPSTIVKIGEGTYGEAFKAASIVCKIVPIDGDIRVNGEIQKKSAELLEEIILSQTLNLLREHEDHVDNACTAFIETIDLRVCQGAYDASLVRAWEDWDEKHGSENDHPKEFPEKQCYVVLVLAHGGDDLEKFVLSTFNEARSLLVQVTAGLAVAEAAFEFEHRDLHWGNILLSRTDAATIKFSLEGRQLWTKTFGLSISIIDFTLSRINTGEAILFLDLSFDQELFEGPKGDRQSETYRKMKEVTEDCWEGSYPKTNVLWLQYLVDILLLKKSFKRTSKNERDLRALKKRLNMYFSAREALSDAFFSDLLVDQAN